jgi:drug/metabolite transporter (DMT)-like permease
LFFGHIWTYSYGAQKTSVAAAMILFSLNPLFTALASSKLVGDSVHPKVKWAMFFGFLALFLLFSEKHDPNDISFWGNVSAFASAILFSGYLLTSKMVRQKTNNISFTTLMYLVCALWFFVFMIATTDPAQENWVPIESSFWTAILALILFPTFLGHALFSYLLKDFNINWMSCGKLLEPGLASIVAYFVFSESPSVAVNLSFVFTAGAVLLLYMPWQKWRRNS